MAGGAVVQRLEGREDAQKALAAASLSLGPPGPCRKRAQRASAGRLRAQVPVRAEGDGVTLAAVTPFGEGGQWSDGKHPVLCRRGGVLPGNPRSVGQEARAWRAAGRGGV